VFIAAASKLVIALTQNPEVIAACSTLAAEVQKEPVVNDALTKLLTESSHNVMNNGDILDHTKDFVSDVITDSSIQRTSGAFLYNTMLYTFVPSAITLVVSLGVGFVGIGAIAAVRGGYVGGDKTMDDLVERVVTDSTKLWDVTASIAGRLLSSTVVTLGEYSKEGIDRIGAKENWLVKASWEGLKVAGRWSVKGGAWVGGWVGRGLGRPPPAPAGGSADV